MQPDGGACLWLVCVLLFIASQRHTRPQFRVGFELNYKILKNTNYFQCRGIYQKIREYFHYAQIYMKDNTSEKNPETIDGTNANK